MKAGSKKMKEQEKLKESEEIYRAVVENISSVIWRSNEKGNTDYISPNVKDVYGYTPEEIYKSGDSLWFGRIHPGDIKKVTKAFSDLHKKGKKYDVEYRIKRKNGEWIWLHDVANKLVTEKGTIYSYGVFEDITERKKAEEELKKLSKAIEITEEAINITAPDGTILYANDSMEKLFNYKKGELIGKNISCVNATPIVKETVKEVMATLKTKGFWRGEVQNKKKDGTEFVSYAVVTAHKDKNGKVLNYVCAQHDITEKKKAEEALKESEEKYKDLFNNMGNAVAIYEMRNKGKDCIFKDFNATAEKIENIKKEDLIGKNVLDVFPGAKKGFVDIFRRVWKTGNAEFNTNFIYSEKGKIDSVREFYTYKLPSGEVVAIYDDITEKKKAEEYLRNSAVYLDTIGDALLVITLDAKITKVNKAFSRLWGYSSKEVYGKSVLKMFPKEEAPKHHEEMRAAAKTGIVRNFESIALTKNRKKILIDVTGAVLRDNNGKLTGFVAIIKDVTERKKAEKAIHESEEKYRTTFENTGTAMMIIEEDTTISLVNRQMEKLTGYSEEEIEGRMSWTEFVLKEDLEMMKKYHNERRKLKSNVPNQYEFRLVDRNGNIKNMFITISIIPGTKKSIASLMDVTERKKAEEELRERNEELEKFNKFVVGRELKMVELKKEINELLRKAGEKAKYDVNLVWKK